jgi:hypothetical protein
MQEESTREQSLRVEPLYKLTKAQVPVPLQLFGHTFDASVQIALSEQVSRPVQSAEELHTLTVDEAMATIAADRTQAVLPED